MSVETIVRLAARGDGVSSSGRFFALAAPGDVLLDDGTLTPGPHRQVPPCRHFPECGGCQLQHVDDEALGVFVRDRIAEPLAAARIAVGEIRPAQLSPPRSRRRATLHAERRSGAVALGFNAARSHRIVDMRECHILRPELFALVAPLRSLLAGLTHRRASVSMTLIDQGVDVRLEGVEADGLQALEAIGAFAAEHRLARLSLDGGFGPETQWEPEPVSVTLGNVRVPWPVGGFLQATCDGEAMLVAAAREALGGAGRVADLFAGVGTFSLAIEGTRLAAEGVRDAALALSSAVKSASKPISLEHRDLFRRPLSAGELESFDGLIVDPPRAGAAEQVAQIAASRVPRLAMISCNPATFTRDAAILVSGGYRLEWVQPVGQFRWSTHVELAAAFSR